MFFSIGLCKDETLVSAKSQGRVFFSLVICLAESKGGGKLTGVQLREIRTWGPSQIRYQIRLLQRLQSHCLYSKRVIHFIGSRTG